MAKQTRKRLNHAEGMTRQVNFRLTEEEHAALFKKARAAGIKVSDLARIAATRTIVEISIRMDGAHEDGGK